MGDFIRMVPKVTLEQFHAFRDERPKEEKWELIAGVPHLSRRPTIVHQRISRNLERILNSQSRVSKSERHADFSIHVLLSSDDTHDLRPDVTVIDTDIGLDQIYATRFYFVAEVLSGSDKPIVLDLKLAFYKQHAPCRGILFARQDWVEAELHVRPAGGDWLRTELREPSDRIAIPDIGDIGDLGRLYRYTPLWRPSFDV